MTGDVAVPRASGLRLLRSVAAVVVGYLVFALSAFALFQLSGQDPHGPASLGVMVGCAVYGVAFALVAGRLARLLAPAPRARLPWTVLAVAGLVALGALVSTIMEGRRGHAIWSSLEGLLLMAPAVLLGGYSRRAA